MSTYFSLRTYQADAARHAHQDMHQFIYPINGCIHIQVGSRRADVERNRFAVIEAGNEHEYYAKGTNQFLVVDLPRHAANRITSELTDGHITEFSMGNHCIDQRSRLAETSFQMIHLYLQEAGINNMMQDTLARCLLGAIVPYNNIGHSIGKKVTTRKEIREACELMHAHYHEDLAIDRIAHQVGLGVSHFYRVFHEQVGQTPLEYITTLRMTRAKQLLETTKDTVLNVCLAVGYSSPATFSRLFQRVFGCAPTQYRRNQ